MARSGSRAQEAACNISESQGIKPVQLKLFLRAVGANESRSIGVHVGVQKGVLSLFKPWALHRLHRRILPVEDSLTARPCTR